MALVGVNEILWVALLFIWNWWKRKIWI